MPKPKDGYFPITFVHRDDLEAHGFDTTAIDDAVMVQLAEKMEAVYVESAFWDNLDYSAEAIGIPKKAE